MTFEEALHLAGQGTKMTRKGYGNDFFLAGKEKLLRGAYIGETSLTQMHAWTPEKADLEATDWHPFTRILPDPWEGCDVPQVLPKKKRQK